MKKLIKLVLFLVAIVTACIFLFLNSYKLRTEDFITDRTTLIYNNQNINKECLENIEKSFNLKNIKGKKYIEKIDSILILSQSKIYKDRIELVGIIDTGKYFPIVYKELKGYFNRGTDNFYILKKEYKAEFGIANFAELYATAYRGLFFLGTDKEEIKKIMAGRTKDKRSFKNIEIINENKDNDLGIFILNQERERLFGIDRVVAVGNIKNNKIYLNAEISGENSIIKELAFQPKKRILSEYINKNTLYISSEKIKNMDTFLLKKLSFKYDNSKQSKRVNKFFRTIFNEISSELNGEMIIDLMSGSYVFAADDSRDNSSEIKDEIDFINNRDICSLKENNKNDMFITIGNYQFNHHIKSKNIEENQFLYCNIKNNFYGEIEINGYCDKDKLKIKSTIDLQKLGGK